MSRRTLIAVVAASALLWLPLLTTWALKSEASPRASSFPEGAPARLTWTRERIGPNGIDRARLPDGSVLVLSHGGIVHVPSSAGW